MAVVLRLAVLAVIAAPVARADAPADLDREIEQARAQLAKLRVELKSAELLRDEAQASEEPNHADMVRLATEAVAQQQSAIAKAQQRLDLLLLRRARPRCADLPKLRDRDQQALEKQQQYTNQGLDELQRWLETNKDAQREAITTGLEFVFGEAADYFSESAKSAGAFHGWLTKYHDALAKQGVPVERLLPKIQRAMDGYLTASTAARGGKVMKKIGTGVEVWQSGRAVAGTILEKQAEADADLRAILEDPDMKKAVDRLSETETPGWSAASGVFQLVMESDQLNKALPKAIASLPRAARKPLPKAWNKLAATPAATAGAAAFAVDAWLATYKSLSSMQRALQQTRVAELNLYATDALKAERECTERRVKDCEAGREPSDCAKEHAAAEQAVERARHARGE
jgi:hypothetical protein